MERLVAHLGVKIDLNRYPYELSGGQQQLVSIMRALVVEPEILFLDEPFSALDYEMTLFMREQLQRIFMETGTTTVLVSHDLEEAVYLADRILLLSRHPARIADFVQYRCGAPARRRHAVGDGVRPRKGALPRGLPARGPARMKRARPVSPGGRRDRPAAPVVCRRVDQGGRPGAAAVAGRYVPRHVDRHVRRQARLRLRADGPSARSSPP